jgi:alcohol dehydrogenase class IV
VYLEKAVSNGADLEARREMMAAAMNGALALQKGLGGVHALSHALGGLPGHDLHHGMLNAVLLPHVLAFNAPAVGHRYRALGEAMRLPPSCDFLIAVANLVARLGLPTRLRDLGLDADALEVAAEFAAKDHTNGTNPRLAISDDYRAILWEAF